MRLLIAISIALTSCKSTVIDLIDISEKQEILELNRMINDHKVTTGNWPTSSDIVSFRSSNILLKRFNKILLTDHTDTTVRIAFRLQYEDFEDPIRLLEMTELLRRYDIGRYSANMELDNLVLQDKIEMGQRTRLTTDEAKQIKKWDRYRIASRQLTIENTRTKERIKIKAGSHIYLFSKDTMLIKQVLPSRYGWANQRAEWILSTINSSDSTINVDLYHTGLLRRLVKLTEIDSLKVKSISGTFRIISVDDTAHNKGYLQLRGSVLN